MTSINITTGSILIQQIHTREGLVKVLNTDKVLNESIINSPNYYEQPLSIL